jgi:hypothetical protein
MGGTHDENVRTNAVSCAVAPRGASLKLRGNILYATTGDVVSLNGFIAEIIRGADILSAPR